MGDPRHETQAQRDARAKQLRHLLETAPHWQQPKTDAAPLEPEPAPASDPGELVQRSIERILANVDRGRTVTERQRQANTNEPPRTTRPYREDA